MKHRTFIWFVLPSLAAMVLFIALPVMSVFVQSLFVEHKQVLVVTENCGPFGCMQETTVDVEATRQLVEHAPLGKFNGLGIYTNRNHLAFAEVADAERQADVEHAVRVSVCRSSGCRGDHRSAPPSRR